MFIPSMVMLTALTGMILRVAPSTQQWNMAKLLISTVYLIFITGIFAFRSKQRKNPSLTVDEFLDIDAKFFTTHWKSVAVGMAGGIVFGFIDNAGLWFGMSALDPYLGQFSENVKAGLGNTYSDALGAFMGTFVGVLISEETGVDMNTTPIWANAIGIVVGCLLGIAVGSGVSQIS